MTFTLPVSAGNVLVSAFETAINALIEGAVSASAIGYPLHDDTTAGLAATDDGEGFSTLDSSGLNLYLNDGGVASLQGAVPLSAVTDALDARVDALEAVPSDLTFQGGWDASGGSFPGSGSASEADYWEVETAGTVDSVSFAVGDQIIALTDSASTSTYAANWFQREGGVVTQTDLDAKADADDAALTGDATAENIAVSGTLTVGGDAVLTEADGVELPAGSRILWLPDVALPSGWYDTGETSDGMKVITNWHPELLFANGVNGVIIDATDASSMWQDTGASTAADAADDPVRRADDLSGNGNHHTAASDDARPLRKTDGQHWWLETDGVDDMLTSTAFGGSVTDWPTIAIAAQTLTATNTACYFGGFFNSASGSQFAALRQGVGDDVGLFLRDTLTQSTALADHYNGPVTIIASPRTPNALVNGHATDTLTEDTFPGSHDTLAIGGLADSSPSYSPCRVFAFVVIDRVLTSDEKSLLEAWLASKSPVQTIRNADVIPIIGQSNAIGRATDDDEAEHPTGVYQFSDKAANGGLRVAARPLDHINPFAGDVGLDVTFSIEWRARYPSKAVVFIPNAEGGTGFISNDWNKGDALYESAVDIINRVSLMYDVEVKAFLWHQGESDIPTGSGTYEASLDQMISDLRSDCTGASSTTPFVLGEISDDFVTAQGANGATVQAIINDTADRVSRTAVASATSPTELATEDGTHFDADGVRKLGRRYAAALQGLL